MKGPAWRPSVRWHDETAVILVAIQHGIENLLSIQADKYRQKFIEPPPTAAERVWSRVASDRLSVIAETLFPTKSK